MTIAESCKEVFSEDNGFLYLKDAEDYWKTPVEFIADHGGDCEDWCIYWRARLIEEGVPESDIFMTWIPWTPLESHMILLVKDGDKYWCLNILSYYVGELTMADMVDMFGLEGFKMFTGETKGVNKWDDCLSRMDESKYGRI